MTFRRQCDHALWAILLVFSAIGASVCLGLAYTDRLWTALAMTLASLFTLLCAIGIFSTYPDTCRESRNGFCLLATDEEEPV